MSESLRVFYCWLCAKRRRFIWSYDCDGGNWHGSCDHALWSERQHRAKLKAEAK